MENIPIHILSESKKEYTKKLQEILTPRIYEGFLSIYQELLKTLSNEMIEKNMQSTSVVKAFQKSLREIPTWNSVTIHDEVDRIEKASQCDYFDRLIECIFLINIRILTSVNMNKNNKKVNAKIPQKSYFIHKCYISCSKELYKNPYVFDTGKGLSPKDRHLNLRDTLTMINNGIEAAIREALPIRDILNQELFSQDDLEMSDEETEGVITEEENSNNYKQENSENQENEQIVLSEQDNGEVEEDDEDGEDDVDDADEEENDDTENCKDTVSEPDNSDMKIIYTNKNNELSNVDDNVDIGNNDVKVIQLRGGENSLEKEVNVNNEMVTEQVKSVEQNNEIPQLGGDVVNEMEGIKEIQLTEDHQENNFSEDIREVNISKEPVVNKSYQTVEKVNVPITEILKPKKEERQTHYVVERKKRDEGFYEKMFKKNSDNYNFTSQSYNDDTEIKNQLGNESSDEEDNGPILLG